MMIRTVAILLAVGALGAPAFAQTGGATGAPQATEAPAAKAKDAKAKAGAAKAPADAQARIEAARAAAAKAKAAAAKAKSVAEARAAEAEQARKAAEAAEAKAAAAEAAAAAKAAEAAKGAAGAAGPAGGTAPGVVPPMPPMPPMPGMPKMPHLPRGLGNDPRDRVAMGNSITVAPGEDVKDVVAFGGTVTVKQGAVVHGDAVAFGGTVEIEPDVTVQGDVVAFGGSVHVSKGATVMGDTSTFGGSIDVDPGATIHGSRVGIGPRIPGIGRLGRVVGHVAADEGPGVVARFFLSILMATVQAVVILVVGLLLIAMLPRRVDRMRRPLATIPGKALLAGFLTVLAFVPLVILLAVSVIGILVIPLLLLAYAVVFFAGWTVVGMAVGRRLLPHVRHTPAIDLLLGTAIFFGVTLFAQVPWVGWLGGIVLAVASLAGVGSVVLARFGNQPRPTAGEVYPPPGADAADARV